MARAILVTGASRGLGRAVALHHAEAEAAHLWLLGRDRRALLESAEEVRARGGTAEILLADVLDRDALAAAAARVPRLDAKLSGRTRPLIRLEPDPRVGPVA